MSSLLASVGTSVLDQASAALTEAAEERLWAQTDSQVTDRVAAALRVKAQADAVLLAAVGEFDARGLAKAQGASSTRAWLTGAHQVDPCEASVLVKTSVPLRGGFEATGAGLAAGAVSLAQARVIIRSVGELPTDLGPELAAAGETLMVGHCQTFEPTKLALIGRRLAECIDPEGTQARDEKPILDKETDAHRDRTLTLSPDTKGAGGYLRARLDAAGYATLAAYLSAATAPGLTPDGSTPPPASRDGRHLGQRRHDALVEATRQMLATGGLPSSGGIKPRIVVTLTAVSLTQRTGAARLPDGNLISPSLARLISCDADLTPVTVDRAGNPLDVGRTRRLFTGPIRTALEVRDRGCAWPGCDRPISWTQAHHIVSWLDGGKTSVDNGVLLCLFHHHEIEKREWSVAIHHGRAWFRPPTWIDPDRTPILNPMHHPPPLE